MPIQFDPNIHSHSETHPFKNILLRLNQKMQHDQLVQGTTDNIRTSLQVDRVVLYYFYTKWEGQVTFESLSNPSYSIFGSTGPDQCFNDEYAALYLAGRVRAITDIETEAIQPCHRDFLRYLHVRANLVVPILTANGLWGLLVAHHCQNPRLWSAFEIEQMQEGATTLASASALKDS